MRQFWILLDAPQACRNVYSFLSLLETLLHAWQPIYVVNNQPIYVVKNHERVGLSIFGACLQCHIVFPPNVLPQWILSTQSNLNSELRTVICESSATVRFILKQAGSLEWQATRALRLWSIHARVDTKCLIYVDSYPSHFYPSIFRLQY